MRRPRELEELPFVDEPICGELGGGVGGGGCSDDLGD